MINTQVRRLLFILLVLSVVPNFGCQTLRSLASLSRLKFKLNNVSNVQLAGIGVAGKQTVSDFSLTDGLSLANSFKQSKFPLSFTLNVAAVNPNDGTKGSVNSNASLTSFEWRLLIDDVQTISGNIEKPITIPGNGQQEMIPLSINVDLYEFFGKNGYDKILNLALAISGAGGTSRLKLDAKPTVSTSLGPIVYPGRITIVDKEFRN